VVVVEPSVIEEGDPWISLGKRPDLEMLSKVLKGL